MHQMNFKNQRTDFLITFPEVTGESLLKQEIVIPKQLRGKLNVVIIAFQQWHQNLVDTWVPFLLNLTKEFPEIEFYELPTIRKMNFLYRSFINGGMRAGIPSKETRGRTITLYIDKAPFKKELQIPDESDIHIYLIDREGQIYWRSQGSFNNEKGDSLLRTVQSLIG